MKNYLLLLPIALATSLAVYLQSDAQGTNVPEPKAAPALPFPAAALPLPSTHSAAAYAPQTPPKSLPASFTGTQVDGGFRLDGAGNLQVDEEVRRLFDYFLSAMGAEPLATSVERLRSYIADTLELPAEGQALDLLGQYLVYKRELVQLERDLPQQAGLDMLHQRESAVQALRARIFSAEVHEAFFASEEAYNTFTLQRLAVQRNGEIGDEAKAAAIDQLRSNLPEELQAVALTQLHTELRTETAKLQASGGTPAQIRQMRQQLVGLEATTRLEALDDQRRHWQARLQEYLAEKARIRSNEGLGAGDKARAIKQLEADRFTPQERLRLRAASEPATSNK
ncbi:lipase secretion chaperone [Metapseudomonas boanensis]|uniref:lipase secretion chaperone n=1 Tax=Metapseudomonas boanensis TaxID=2822138 RepID=UPI0032E8CCC8